MKNKGISRREFLGTTAFTVAGIAVASQTSFGSPFGAPAYIKNLGKPNSLFNGVQIGVITYSWRSMPVTIETVLQYCIECNLSAVELKGEVEEFAGAPIAPPRDRSQSTADKHAEWEEYTKKMATWRASVPMEKFTRIKKMYHDAGIKIYAYKPAALGANNTDAEVDYAFRAAKALGATQATVELPTDPAQTKRLGDIAAKNKIYAAYHGHLQQTFTAWDVALEQSAYNAMNFDMGHYVAAGFDPIPLIKARHNRISSMHVKDRKTKAHGGANLPWGEGDTPIIPALQLMSKNNYAFPATIELEYAIPEGSDAVKEVAKCVEFARKALGA